MSFIIVGCVRVDIGGYFRRFLTVCEIIRFPWSYISPFKDKLKDNGSWQSVYQEKEKKTRVREQ